MISNSLNDFGCLILDHEIPSNNGDLGSPSGSPKKESIPFTDRSIQALGPTDKRSVVWAKGLKGLGIRITPKGTKSFVYKYDIDDQDRWMTFGQYPKMKLAEALQMYAAALAKVEAGEDPADEHVEQNRLDRQTLTVKQLADEYIEKYAKPRKRSWEEDRRILDHDVLPRLGAKKASKITRRDIVRLLDEIVARGAPVQANRTLSVLRKMFNFAIDRDVISTSPCFRLKPPSAESSKTRYLTLDEIKTFWTGLDTAPITRQTGRALRLLLLTLQRTSEVAGMNTAELDLTARTWIIPAERTKNGRAQLVPLSSAAIQIIEECAAHTGEDGYVFSGEGSGSHIQTASLSRAIARNLDHFGIPKFTPHDLRRTGSTQLAAFKVPRFDRDRLLNHTDQSIGAVYDIHEYEDEKRAALNMWADIIAAAARTDGKVDLKKLRKAIAYQNYFTE